MANFNITGGAPGTPVLRNRSGKQHSIVGTVREYIDSPDRFDTSTPAVPGRIPSVARSLLDETTEGDNVLYNTSAGDIGFSHTYLANASPRTKARALDGYVAAFEKLKRDSQVIEAANSECINKLEEDRAKLRELVESHASEKYLAEQRANALEERLSVQGEQHKLLVEQAVASATSALKLDFKSQQENFVAALSTKSESLLNNQEKRLRQEMADQLDAQTKGWEAKFLAFNKEKEQELASLRAEISAYKKHHELADVTISSGGGRIDELKADIFGFVPGTVNTVRGAAAAETTVDWGTQEAAEPKRVHFATSTPGPEVPPKRAAPVPLPRHSISVNRSAVSAASGSSDASAINILAKEFKNIQDPKLQKLKGSTSASGTLFFNSWRKDIMDEIRKRELDDNEAIQLIKSFTTEKARGQVDYYLDTCLNPSYIDLLEDLASAFSCGEDEATLKSAFYSRKQNPKEDEDTFAEALQVAARKVLSVSPAFRGEVEEALKRQFATGLTDPSAVLHAKQLLMLHKGSKFATFKAEVVKFLGVRERKAVKSKVVEVDSPQPENPSKKPKRELDDLSTAVAAVLEQNRLLAAKLDAMQPGS